MSTPIPSQKDLKRAWVVLDGDGAVIGRLASKAAHILIGKHKPTYTQFLDTGDHVVVVNADKVALTGRKAEGKIYRTHSGYMGGLKETKAKDMLAKRPVRAVEEAVKGMRPKTKLGRAMFSKLKVYAGAAHPHQAQKPSPLKLN